MPTIIIQKENITEEERNSLLMEIKKFLVELRPNSVQEVEKLNDYGYYRHYRNFLGIDSECLASAIDEFEDYVLDKLASTELWGKVQLTGVDVNTDKEHKLIFTVKIELHYVYRK